MQFRIPRGTSDILPAEAELWRYIKTSAINLYRRYNYREIVTPIFEYTELFQRGVGETTDIVEKEMYTFMDKGNRSLTLRPEGTAPVVRAYIENKLYANPDVVKLFYIGPMFRYERPQAGRTRQFTQIGIEAFGSEDPALDAEIIILAMQQFAELALHDIRLEINSVGCTDCRPKQRKDLYDFLFSVKEELCEDCQRRIKTNPLRVLDCKNPQCQALTVNAPTMDGYLCADCLTHYIEVKKNLDTIGIKYLENPRMVRGLDYYTQTAFEIISVAEGSTETGTLCGGGRYNGLVKDLGGPDISGIGYALSIERVIALKTKELLVDVVSKPDVFLVALDTAAKDYSVVLLQELRTAKIAAEIDYLDRKIKPQLKAVDRLGCKYALIIGDKELAEGLAILRDMETGEQELIPLTKITDSLIERLK